MSISGEIRGALELRLATVAGHPVIYNEGVKNRPVPGKPFLEAVIVPTSERAVTIGDNPVILHEGLFMVSVVYPEGNGVGDAEAMADAIKQVFRAQDALSLGNTVVRLRFAERRPTIHSAEWLRIPVAISFFTHDQRY